MQKLLAWTCLGCALLFAGVSLTAIFAGESSGVGIASLLNAAIAIAVVGMLMAVALVVLGRLD